MVGLLIRPVSQPLSPLSVPSGSVHTPPRGVQSVSLPVLSLCLLRGALVCFACLYVYVAAFILYLFQLECLERIFFSWER